MTNNLNNAFTALTSQIVYSEEASIAFKKYNQDKNKANQWSTSPAGLLVGIMELV